MGLAAVLLAAARCLWPGDTFVLGDAVALFKNALAHNGAGTLALHGLTNGHAPYGPLPTWIYQAFLGTTGSLEAIVVVKALLFSAAQLWFATEVTRGVPALRRVATVALFLSPHLWIASRDLWDNSWLIPAAGVSAAAYLRFARRPSVGTFAVVLLGSTAMLLIHLMAIPLVTGLCVAMARRQSDWLRSHRGAVAGVLVACLLLASPYLLYLLRSLGEVAAANAGAGNRMRFLAGFANALLGPRIFQFVGSDFRLGLFWWRDFPGVLGPIVSAAYVLSFVVLIAGWRGAYRLLRGATLADEGARHFALAGTVALVLHVVMSTAMRLGDYEHYFNALWPVLFFCLLLGVEDLRPRLRARAVVVGLGCLAICFVAMVAFVHANAGARRGNYGASVTEWGRIVDIVPLADGAPVRIEPGVASEGFELLRELRRHRPAPPGKVPPGHEWLVRYRDRGAKWDSRLVAELVERPERR